MITVWNARLSPPSCTPPSHCQLYRLSTIKSTMSAKQLTAFPQSSVLLHHPQTYFPAVSCTALPPSDVPSQTNCSTAFPQSSVLHHHLQIYIPAVSCVAEVKRGVGGKQEVGANLRLGLRQTLKWGQSAEKKHREDGFDWVKRGNKHTNSPSDRALFPEERKFVATDIYCNTERTCMVANVRKCMELYVAYRHGKCT